MKYQALGSSKLVVSQFGFGAMTLGHRGPRGIAGVDQAGADALVGAAIDAGVTFFDTADIYNSGESETMLGRALGRRRDQVILATKVGLRSRRDPGWTGLSAAHIARSIDASLARLGTDRVDLYIAHRIDPSVPLEEMLAAFDSLVEQGKVREVGFSNWPAWLAAKAIAMQRAYGWRPFATGQVCYSLVDREVEHDIVPCALSEGYGLTVYSPLAMGRLTGKYRNSPAGGRLTQFTSFAPPEAGRLDRVLDSLQVIAARRAATMAQVALAWLASRPAVSAILLGASNAGQLVANLGAAAVDLTDEDIAALDRASATPAPYPVSALASALSPDEFGKFMAGARPERPEYG